MRGIRFGLAIILVFVAGRCFAQQDPYAQPQQQQAQGRGGRQPSPEQLAEQQLQDAQRQIREGNAGRGNPGLGVNPVQTGNPAGQARGGTPAPPSAEEVADEEANNYINKDDLFSVTVPCKFTSKDIVWATEYDSKVPGHVYSCKDGDNDYEMSVINYTDLEKIRAAQEHTDAASGGMYGKIDIAASVDYASTKLRNEAAKVTYDAFHYMNLIPGHELQYTLPSGRRVYAGIYLHEYRLYIMKATVPAKGIPPLLYTQSFAAIRPDGTAIRYGTIYRHPW
jgi:hypothetical protein